MDELKKATLLLHSLIFHYHGLDEDEKILLQATANKIDGQKELDWANNFIAEDYISAFERSRPMLKGIFGSMKKEARIEQLIAIWKDNYQKGYVTEMETKAMLHLAQDWDIEQEFKKAVEVK